MTALELLRRRLHHRGQTLLPALAVIVLGLTMLRPRLDDAFPKPGKKQEVGV